MKELLSVEKAKDILRKSGLRLTKQRLLILELLHNNTTHPTADDIIQKILKKCGHVTVATVYNTLDVLTGQGLISRIDGLENRSHYDPDTEPHYHAICSVCKKVFDVESDGEFSLPEGFLVKDCLIQGICSECRKK